MYLLFKINDTLCALPSCEVRELMRDVPVFALPFVPRFVDGVLNRHGEPYAVVDAACLMGGAPQKASLFLVLQDGSRTCLRITEAGDFHGVPPGEVAPLEGRDAGAFFSASFRLDGAEVLVLDAKAVVRKAGADLGAA